MLRRPIVQDVILDRSTYPPERVTGEPHTSVGFEAAEGTHHANVAFADQVHNGKP